MLTGSAGMWDGAALGRAEPCCWGEVLISSGLNFSSERAATRWNREVVESLSPEVLKKREDAALGDVA